MATSKSIRFGISLTAIVVAGIFYASPYISPTFDPNAVDSSAAPKPKRPAADQTVAAPVKIIPFDTGPLSDGDIPVSAYANALRRRFETVLNQAQAEVLLAPCTIGPGFGLDRVERLLISAEFAQEFARLSALKVVDPYLVARALGEGRRRISMPEIAALARLVQAREYLTCAVAYQIEGGVTPDGSQLSHKMTVTFERHFVEREGRAESPPVVHSMTDLVFTDEQLPHVVLRQKFEQVLTALGFDTAKSRDNTEVPVTPAMASLTAPQDVLPASPSTLLELKADTPEAQLAQLEFLGSLYPAVPSAGRQRVFAKALLAAYALPDDSLYRPVAVARALFYLERRPAALAALKGITTPEALALQAALNGDLPGLIAAVSTMPPGVSRLIAQFDLMDLQLRYGVLPEKKADDTITTLSAPLEGWTPFIESRLAEGDPWRLLDAGTLKRSLDRVYPLDGFRLKDLIARGQTLSEVATTAMDLDLAVIRHIDKLLSTKPKHWCCATRREGVDRWDLLNLYESTAEAALFKRVERRMTNQIQPDIAMKMLDSLDPALRGHPDFARLRAESALKLSMSRNDRARSELQQLANDAIRETLLWSDGQSLSTAQVMYLQNSASVPPPSPGENEKARIALSFDFPPSPFAIVPGVTTDAVVTLWALDKRLKYATSYFSPVEHHIEFLPRYARNDDIAPILEKLEGRFIGSSGKPMVEAKFLFKHDSDEQAIALLRQAIDSGSRQWDLHKELATALLERGRDADALEILLKYPGFAHDSGESSIIIVNTAGEAAAKFFWRGLEPAVRKLCAIAAPFHSGAEGDIQCRTFIAMLDGDYAQAAALSIRHAKRYRSEYAYRNYLSLLFAYGFSADGWLGVEALMSEFDGPQIWAAADVGARIGRLSEAEVRAWLRKPQVVGVRRGNDSFASRHAILHYAVGRDIPADFSDFIAELEGPTNTHVSHIGKFVIRPLPTAAGASERAEIVGPSSYGSYGGFFYSGQSSGLVNADPLLPSDPPEATAPSDLVLFAQGYAALRSGEQELAARSFETMAKYYQIERPDRIWMLAYFSAAIAPTASRAHLRDYLAKFGPLDRRFDWHLAMGFMAAADNDINAALAHLDTALDQRPDTERRPVYTQYQWAEACEWLWLRTHDEGFRTRLIRWARAISKTEPYTAWPYAVEAQYGESGEQRDAALGMARYLDPQSIRLRDIPDDDKARGATAFARDNPFNPRSLDEPGTRL